MHVFVDRANRANRANRTKAHKKQREEGCPFFPLVPHISTSNSKVMLFVRKGARGVSLGWMKVCKKSLDFEVDL